MPLLGTGAFLLSTYGRVDDRSVFVMCYNLAKVDPILSVHHRHVSSARN